MFMPAPVGKGLPRSEIQRSQNRFELFPLFCWILAMRE